MNRRTILSLAGLASVAGACIMSSNAALAKEAKELVKDPVDGYDGFEFHHYFTSEKATFLWAKPVSIGSWDYFFDYREISRREFEDAKKASPGALDWIPSDVVAASFNFDMPDRWMISREPPLSRGDGEFYFETKAGRFFKANEPRSWTGDTVGTLSGNEKARIFTECIARLDRGEMPAAFDSRT